MGEADSIPACQDGGRMGMIDSVREIVPAWRALLRPFDLVLDVQDPFQLVHHLLRLR